MVRFVDGEQLGHRPGTSFNASALSRWMNIFEQVQMRVSKNQTQRMT